MQSKVNIPKVKDILIKKVQAFRASSSTLEAVQGLNEHRISSAPVINEQDEIVGFLSESDLIKCMANCIFYDESRNPTIESIMSRDVAVADSDWDIFELENFFISKGIRSAPVIDSDNHLIGIVTRRDALIALEKAMHDIQEHKTEIKTPVELNLHQRIRMILNKR